MAIDLPLFIQPAQLNDVLEHEDIQVVAVADAAPHAQSHVPGALQIQLRDIVTSNPPTVGLLPDTSILTAALAEAGLRNNAHIVVYDLSNGAQAARLAYTLLAIGHDAVSMLDGGLNAWLDDDFELASGISVPPAPGIFDIRWQDTTIADHEWINAHLDNDNVQVIDVRSAEEYMGVDVRSARGGHIPGAINLDWHQLLQSNGRLKPESELRDLLAKHGITPGKEAITYCQSHMRSSFAFLVLKLLGYDKVRGYPGAWSDWGNRDDTPIER